MAEKESIGEYVDIDSLIEWEKNPRINDHAVSKVARSIERFGFASPIIAKQSDKPPYIILAGHTRFRASKQIGLQNVPVRFLNISQTEAELFSIADNKLGEIADWDHDMLKELLNALPEHDLSDIGFSQNELSNILNDTITNFDHDNEWTDMPEFVNEENNPFLSIKVHFETEEDMQNFSKLIKQNEKEHLFL